MTSADGAPRRFKPLWLLAWPVWILLVFASLATARLLPAGYIRAAVAAPILLMVPGSLTLGAIFSQRRRPQGMVFVCYAAVLSAVWSAFASLTLYVLGVPITANGTYWCLLAVSAVLAIVAEARLLLGRPEGSHRTGSTNTEPNPFDTGSNAQIQAGIRGAKLSLRYPGDRRRDRSSRRRAVRLRPRVSSGTHGLHHDGLGGPRNKGRRTCRLRGHRTAFPDCSPPVKHNHLQIGCGVAGNPFAATSKTPDLEDRPEPDLPRFLVRTAATQRVHLPDRRIASCRPTDRSADQTAANLVD